jgi:RNA polymerase sigma-70 factor (ECF subfamily)
MTGTVEDESALIAALREGDEHAYVQLVDRHTPAMLRVARGYVRSHQIAEEVVQEAWIGVLKGISRFEGRSSLRTWIFTVMVNIAKTRGVRERRSFDAEVAAFTGGTVDAALFRGPGEEWAGDWKNWEEYPRAFPESPEGSLLARELADVAQAELERLPDGQRTVVTLRDMLGFDSAEVCQLLDISAVNQRVLLHRGRAALRLVLESYLGVGP